MNLARKLDFDMEDSDNDQLDTSSGYETSSANTTTDSVTLESVSSPPYKRVRALRLFDNPFTPVIRRTNHYNTRSGASAIDKPAANINPFTPDNLSSKKRTRSNTSLQESPKFEVSEGKEIEQPTKRRALSNNNIRRYHEEFVELELIGSGQFGSVYKCINRLDGYIYAVKKSSQPLTKCSLEKWALNEVYAHSVLGGNQHVVRYHSAWVEDNRMLIQNEYCNRGSLAQRISQDRLSISELQQLILQVAAGLHFIHSKGLVHLDIKPANIFLSCEKKVQCVNYDSMDEGFEDLESSFSEEEQISYKIGDLGHVTSISNPQVEEGDCRYLPKEILNDDYSNLTKADIFSLGATCLEAAGSGPLPKNGELWHKIRDGKLPPLEVRLNRDLIELIKAMLNSDPLLRPSPIEIMQHRAMSSSKGKKSWARLQRDVNILKLKNEILSKQLVDASNYIKAIKPDVAQIKAATSSRKLNRSSSTTDF